MRYKGKLGCGMLNRILECQIGISFRDEKFKEQLYVFFQVYMFIVKNDYE